MSNKLLTTTCELGVVYHCNMSCRSCSHFSPYFEPSFARPEVVSRDLSILSEFYHVERFSLCGGEPLLHPDLVELIRVVKDTSIADKTEIVTNGLLLNRMKKAFWESIDQLTISVYPGTKNTIEKHLSSYQQKALKYSFELKLRYMNCFRKVFTELGTKDKGLVQRIYDTCKNAHIFKCHNIDRGFLYRCPQSVFIPMILKSRSSEFRNDRIKIEKVKNFRSQLSAFLKSKEPLGCCYYCLGSVGKLFPHQQIQADETDWRHPTETLVDIRQLLALEKKPDASDLY